MDGARAALLVTPPRMYLNAVYSVNVILLLAFPTINNTILMLVPEVLFSVLMPKKSAIMVVFCRNMERSGEKESEDVLTRPTLVKVITFLR